MKALADYKHQYYLPAEKDGYSGVALLSKIEPIKVDLGFGTDEAKEHDAEGCRQTLAIKSYLTYYNISNFMSVCSSNWSSVYVSHFSVSSH